MENNNIKFNHYPVMLKECIEGLEIKDDGIYVDCTLGGGSHSEEILKRLKSGKLIAFDKDLEAISHTKEKLKKYKDKIIFINDDFKNAITYLDKLSIEKIDGFLMDLGVSSYQIDTPERGFSYMVDAPLDMRMDKTQSLDAKAVVNGYSEEELVKILFEYGEEDFARRIAKNIIETREIKPIETTFDLVAITDRSIPAKFRKKGSHSAKKTFQAIRIEVNGELDGLKNIIEQLVKRLNNGGRAVIISFHSLEDRIVKQTFNFLALKCVCPPHQPICDCGKIQEVKIINKKPIVATEEEIKVNKRSLSAKLRIVEKL